MDSIKKMHFILKQLFYTYYKKQMNFQIKGTNLHRYKKTADNRAFLKNNYLTTLKFP